MTLRPRRLLTLTARTLRDSVEDRVPKLAAEVAFFTLLSLPPAMLAILGAAGFLADALGPQIRAEIQNRILDLAATALTESTVESIVRPAVDTLLAEGRADIISVGVVLAIWSASRATAAVIDTMRIAYDMERVRPGWKRRLVALALTLGGGLTVALLLPALVAGPRLGARLAEPLGLGTAVEIAGRVLYWPLIVVVGVALLAGFYHLALPRRTPWVREIPGAALALSTWALGSVGVRIYGRWTLESGSTYGSLSAPLILLVWLYVLGIAVLVGAELNSEIEKMWPTRSPPDGAEDAPFRVTFRRG